MFASLITKRRWILRFPGIAIQSRANPILRLMPVGSSRSLA